MAMAVWIKLLNRSISFKICTSWIGFMWTFKTAIGLGSIWKTEQEQITQWSATIQILIFKSSQTSMLWPLWNPSRCISRWTGACKTAKHFHQFWGGYGANSRNNNL